jgi:hypothetical protein
MQKLMGSRHHRVAHALWHTMRADLSADQIKMILKAYGNEWKNPRKMCPLPKASVNSKYNSYDEMVD